MLHRKISFGILSIAFILNSACISQAGLSPFGQQILMQQCGGNLACMNSQAQRIMDRCANARRKIAKEPETIAYYQGIIAMCGPGESDTQSKINSNSANRNTPQHPEWLHDQLREETYHSPYNNIKNITANTSPSNTNDNTYETSQNIDVYEDLEIPKLSYDTSTYENDKAQTRIEQTKIKKLTNLGNALQNYLSQPDYDPSKSKPKLDIKTLTPEQIAYQIQKLQNKKPTSFENIKIQSQIMLTSIFPWPLSAACGSILNQSKDYNNYGSSGLINYSGKLKNAAIIAIEFQKIRDLNSKINDMRSILNNKIKINK